EVKHMQNFTNLFLGNAYKVIKEQINRARHILRNNLLQFRSREPNDRTPLVVTYSSQMKPLTRILNDLQPILDKNTALSKALDRRPMLAYRQPPTSSKY
ncbi:hypothetical protein JRQ81_018904, partial [Phrynocephalus forsythii]